MSSCRPPPTTTFATAVLLSLAAAAVAQNSACISLSGSTQCPAFNASSISTGDALTGLFPFLAYVSDTDSFDQYLAAYVQDGFVQERYVQLLGCSNIDSDNTTDVYARYTTSVLCNAIVQNSIDDCSLSDDQSRPLCADTCAEYAISEQEIASAPELCGTTSNNVNTQIRADFTNCALPANALTGSCISGVENEADNCGYLDNLQGLCSFCASSSPNATDSCCNNSNLNFGDEPHSPEQNSNNEEFSSPEMGSGQSEQLPFFKDYYSQDEITPGDAVAVLWAYQPRANDEFELERGEMIKVMGIWDDGWATGMKITQTAEEWDANRKIQRDSGMSNGSQRPVETVGEVKAFPLVCVCLPQHWRRTIDGDSSAGESDRPPPHSP
ncbi:putative sh3 domain-containing protein [Diplodia seriata]|uniref:Putative sh3 domain-containing protein n=1 Tax=Diplodia seriata TaxID=420778 RepID=A0A0G2EP14_9PEZI|nr:putative sh3 domain-containing protein [Diplodia seriata]